jgi:hypothetical protein
VRVLVVWEPILATDWTAPSGSALARIPSRGVRQFWDPKHVVAQALSEIAKQKAGQPVPDCCVQKGFYWDEAILYASHSHWKDAPAAVFWNGPVVRVIAGLEKTFNEQQ